MNLQVSTHGESEATIIEDDDDTDETVFENERCGICTDVVIDRGVLDCCHHWFCFACIDNWATITNLCPLCKNEFQLITCLPVYDTIGSIKNEEHSLSRDDDWCIQGKNNTLSFPSYYIDEDAVICLDGDACKIRNGLSTSEEDLTFDTSIACDSCDIWYHAFCVGFNPECTSDGSWLCPRCIIDEAQNGVSVQNLDKHSALRNADLGWTIDPSFSGKVSVSVADAGETAVVVSMVEGKQRTDAGMTSLSEFGLDFNIDKETETSLPDADTVKLDVQLENGGCIELVRNSLICSDEKGSIASAAEFENSSDFFFDISPEMVVIPSEVEVELKEKSLALPSLEVAGSDIVVIQPNTDLLETSLELSTSQGAAVSSCYSATHVDMKANNAEGTVCNPCNSDGFKVSSSLRCDTSEPKNELSKNKSVSKLHLGLSVLTFSSVDKLAHDATENQVCGISRTHSLERSLSDKMVTNNNEDMIDVIRQKEIEISGLTGKCTKKIQSYVTDADKVNNIREREIDAEYPVKKAKLDGKSQMLPSTSEVNTSVPDCSQKCSIMAEANNNDSLRYSPPKEAITPDIMSIVQEIEHRSHDGPEGPKFEDQSIEKRESAVGLRVKKIMRRVGDKKESSILVQKLRKEIKEAVRDQTSNNIGTNNDFDEKLLTAFRAAVVKPTNDLFNKFDPSRVGAKKSLLQKGKKRESLTKKIYGTSTGRRRRAWDRDWEIEFWKHRCKRTKPEKFETLQSVLELLKKATNSCSDNSEMDQGPEGETTNSILSRVYLADASVFPRKDDIKPLSALTECSSIDNLEQKMGKSFNNLSENESQTVHAGNMAKCPAGISKSLSQVISSDNTGKRDSTSSNVGAVPCRKGNGQTTGPPPISESGSNKGRVQSSKELASRSDLPKSDKRKWALEVLARKNALTNLNASKGKQEDKVALKGNYPLLAQLPMDMRPVPKPSRHNKVHVSVRQAQLYRITEQYLRRANLPIIRRTADTELAVADAVNVEKEIFERSNSKLVYINLCSQVLSQCSNKTQSAETVASHTTTTAEVTDQVAEETSSNPSARRWSNVEEALKLAGLSSDSPPTSPYRLIKDPNEEDDPHGNAREEDLDDVLDIDSHPELDIYGDFEYNLEYEGYTDSFGMSSALRVLKLPEQQKGDSKMKVVLSIPKCEESDSLLDSKHDTLNPQSSDNEEAGHDHDILIAKRSGKENAMQEIRMDTPLLPKPSEGEIYKEPSLAECEELYGPEKEPLINRISNEVIGELSKSMEMEAAARSTIPVEIEMCKSRDGTAISGFRTEGCAENNFDGCRAPFNHESSGGDNSPAHSLMSENVPKEGRVKSTSNKSPDPTSSISKKVEAYVKEHIRPLCKSGVITVEQYRWAVGKTTDKVMKYHYKAKNANFLIKEGEKVKKLAEQYVEAAQQK